MDNYTSYWQRAIAMMRENLAKISMETWIDPLTPVSYSNGIFTIAADTDWFINMVSVRYTTIISACLSTGIGESVTVKFILTSQIGQDSLKTDSVIGGKNSNAIGLSPKYTFDNFVVGPSNRFAHAASLAVAETPSKAYNPLFLYGSSGLGKTHLLHAIGNYIATLNPSLKVMYISSEYFTNDLINSIKEGKNEQFRQKYRQIDVLLIDDIQFIGGKTTTEEEFFHTFNYLHQADKQIIISSDRPPTQMNTLEERLRSRFEWGLICDIQAPDYETRFAILQQKLQGTHTEIPADVLDYIASNVDTNIRELEGALTKILAFSRLQFLYLITLQ